MEYTTKYIDAQMEVERHIWEKNKIEHQGDDCNNMDIYLERLEERINNHNYDWIIDSFCDLNHSYSSRAKFFLRLDGDVCKAKECYYLAALSGEMCFTLLHNGFSHHQMDSGSLYDFKKNNFNYTKNAILANEPELALRIAARDTLEGALLLREYERAKGILPEDPEDESICRNQLAQCMWAIAYNNEKAFNKYLEKRIKVLRRQARISATTLDSWGLAVIKLANMRGISCNLNVIELPLNLLDDMRVDTNGLALPMADRMNNILS